MADPVLHERVGSAFVLKINRPERRNAIDSSTAEAMVEAFRSFEGDDSARVLVVTGAGDLAFSTGADLKAIDTLVSRVTAAEGVLGLGRLSSRKPTIAAISGWCAAGGLVLALWCDLRIATDTSRFAFLDRRPGVPLMDGGPKRLAAIVGVGRALDLIMTGREAGAAEALAMGLVTELVPAGQHLARALEIAELLAGFPQETLLLDRGAVLEDLHRQLEASWDEEIERARATAEITQRGAQEYAARRSSRTNGATPEGT